ncbi:hypothetical protein DL762_008856 [Monosporascus cannonballus]|uniref:Uncharacterized protein n=1 Tax=Monosporascus cannonballus TaxID=155416 RepID=A0ABY0GVW8_9PEZI|nr:hypothetical protein DL763_011064 [Monosporascus cannonballus]RYO78119.1 hypothetical protein DL762_008856 [Monosporascus cannonballus]
MRPEFTKGGDAPLPRQCHPENPYCPQGIRDLVGAESPRDVLDRRRWDADDVVGVRAALTPLQAVKAALLRVAEDGTLASRQGLPHRVNGRPGGINAAAELATQVFGDRPPVVPQGHAVPAVCEVELD